jgi:hypothetical protein
MKFGEDFQRVNPAHAKRYLYLAEKRGYDGDDYLDLAQGCLFLDMVCGSMQTNGTSKHRVELFANALKSEHDYAPERRVQKEMQRATQKNRERNRVFQEVGLDGVALLELLNMEAGPKFGRLMRQIQDAIVGEGTMPAFPALLQKEIDKRAGEYYHRVFKLGI